ncbi:MAG: DUF4073 domain-containing protein [Microbacterium sp.]
MHSPSTPAARRRRGATAVGALAVSGALLLSPALTAASAAPANAAHVAQADAVAAAASQLTVADTTFAVGDSITAEYATDRPTDRNWVAVYPASAETPCSGCGFAWDYAPGESGSVSIPLNDRSGEPLPAGDYRLEYLYDDGWTRVGEPVSFTIEGDVAVPDPEQSQPGDPAAPVEIDPVSTDVSTDGVIHREGFSIEGAPEGWTVESESDAVDYGAWTFTTRADWTGEIDEMRGRFARPLGALAVADAQQSGGALDTTLTSAPVSVDGLASARLTFDSHYRGAAGQSGVVSVSFDGGASSEILRLDSASVADDYDARQMNYAQDVVVEVPEGAEEAVFSWQFTAEEGARYWAIDSVAVHEVLKATEARPTQAWVMSDIQGHPGDFEHALGDYSEIAPEADGMLLVGDIVNSGTSGEWQEIYDVMDATADIRPRQTVAANGNHERYAPGGFDANMERFFAFAEREKPWAEYVIEGSAGDLPVIVLGQEFGSPTDVAMSDEQVAFFEERLAHWTALDKQVVVMTHFPLGDTVSASWIPGYHGHHQMNDRLTSILGNYPNAILFTGHTHYPAELGDWAVQRRTDDGHPDGFRAINTIAMHIEWDARGENTAGISEVTTRDINQGLTLDSYGDRVVVTAYDFATDEQLRQVEIANPLVAFDADVRPAPEDPDPETPDPENPEPENPEPETPGNPGGGSGDTGSGSGEAENPSADDESASGDLATTGADLPWGLGLAAGALVLGGLGLALRARRNA